MWIRSEEERSRHRNVWVVAEARPGEVKEVTYELLGAGQRLAAARKAELWCVVLGHDTGRFAGECFRRGAQTVLVVDDPRLAEFVDETHANVLRRLIEKYRPEIVLCGATARGRALIPRVAVQVHAGLTADCTGLDIEEGTGLLLQTRPAFGGNILATIKCPDHRPQMATVRPRVMPQPRVDPDRRGNVIREGFLPADEGRSARVLKRVVDSAKANRLADANFIVTGGRGCRGKEGFRLLHEFAHLVGGAVGASRAAVDAGWVDYAHQVGQTGQTVQPKTYFACGVSGQIQHLVGMQSADLIIAIDKNPNTPMMKLADYAIVGDLFEILPAMMRELRHV